MFSVTLEHFKRAATDIGVNGDNDTLPFDDDNRFIQDMNDELAELAFEYFCVVNTQGNTNAAKKINALNIFSERLLVPTGPAGFRITTKIHPFWNIYFNGIGVAIAERHEVGRSDRAHSYRYLQDSEKLFDRNRSWRAYLEATINDEAFKKDGAVIVRTDISSFYEHIYHHRLENCVNDLFPNNTVAKQVDRFLNQFSSGRSFGLPVGGQCARILAELLMSSIDQTLTAQGIAWHRYVDDFILISNSQEDAYQSLSALSHALADYGLSLNRSKTTILSAKHYGDYVKTQLGVADEDTKALREVDLYFDPYSDSADTDYSELKETVQGLDVRALLRLELRKAQPETFLVAQIARTLKFHSPSIAIQLCSTLLNQKNLHAFRASWSTIMRGVAAVRADQQNEEIFSDLDDLLDSVPIHSAHLLKAEASCLHYLKTIKACRTDARSQFVLELYNTSRSETLKKACIDCWRIWKDRPSFIMLRNQWQNVSVDEQRIIWRGFYGLGDEGRHARNQVKAALNNTWALGIETGDTASFYDIYKKWASHDV